MPTISLTNSERVAIVNEIFYDDLLAIGPWRLNDGYAEIAIGTRFGHHAMHKIILEMAGHDMIGREPDHRDRDKLNNTLANLRPATSRQNTTNRGRQRNNTSGYIGVYYHKQTRKWEAQIRVNGKRLYIGLFDDPIDAAKAYDAALLAGPDAEYGVLNFPP